MTNFLRDDDLSPAAQSEVLDLAAAMKADRTGYRPLAGPLAVAVIFEKPSLRTRVSFETGIAELGGHPVIIDARTTHFGRGETLGDAARVLSRYVAAIVMRTSADSRLAEIAAGASVPVVNALTDGFHPCQILADLLTVRERFGSTAGRTLAFLGDAANNMAQSYLLGGATAGMHVRVAGPPGFVPDEAVLKRAAAIAATTGGSVDVGENPTAAVAGADVIATDTWTSMGQESEKESRKQAFEGFQVDDALMSAAGPDARFYHCLPAYRGVEVAADVIDGPASRVIEQAHNRLHSARGLLAFLMGVR